MRIDATQGTILIFSFTVRNDKPSYKLRLVDIPILADMISQSRRHFRNRQKNYMVRTFLSRAYLKTTTNNPITAHQPPHIHPLPPRPLHPHYSRRL